MHERRFTHRSARRTLGIGDDESVSDLTIRDMHPQWAARIVLNEALAAAAKDGVWEGETAFMSRSDEEVPTLQVILAHKDTEGEVEYYSTIAHDITDRKRMEDWLTYLATHDPLTGVLNRSSFQQKLHDAVGQSKQDGSSGALLYLDLDDFKDINDSFGHQAGDEILQHITQVFRENLRPSDEIARIGGDEFAILLPNAEPANAQAIARRLLTQLGEESVTYDGQTIRLRASIGMATYPDDADTVKDLLINADLSMYAAKREGGHQIVVCETGELGRKQARSRLD